MSKSGLYHIYISDDAIMSQIELAGFYAMSTIVGYSKHSLVYIYIYMCVCVCVCVCVATLMSSDRTKQICLWMSIYIYIYIYILNIRFLKHILLITLL